VEQQNAAVTFLAFFVAAKLGKAALSVAVDVYSPAGAKIVNAAAAVEIGGGLYSYTLSGAATPAVGEYVALFTTADTTVDQRTIPALWSLGRAGVEHLDADVSSVAGAAWDEATADHAVAGSTGVALAAAGGAADPLLNAVPGAYPAGTAGAVLGGLGAGAVTVVSPITAAGEVSLQRGDDYAAADGRQIDWVEDGGAGWPVLTAAGVAFEVGSLALAMTVVVATGAGKTVRLELDAADTVALDGAGTTYRVVATLASGHVVTLATGRVVVSG